MKRLIIIFVLCFNSFSILADVDVTSFMYEEKESGTEAVNVRYLVSEKFLRIDNGALQDDFLLFDRQNKTIYSVNQVDRSILVIKSYQWRSPEFSFAVKVNKKTLDNAPEIMGKKVMDYSVSVNDEMCHRVQLLPDAYSNEMKAFIEYQNVLSGQQAKIISHTPAEMQAPCFLVDQVYNAGNYYHLGLPVQEWHSRGYVKLLRDYKQLKLADEWFVLPEGFDRYSLSN